MEEWHDQGLWLVPVKKRKLSPNNQPNPAPKPRLKNRYIRNAKLSEYKFLHILRGFADEKTSKELAATMNVSEKSIRAHYEALRNHLIMAVIASPYDFGKTGSFILKEGKVSKNGRSFFGSVISSELFKRYSKVHAPRTKDISKLQGLVFDLSIRIFCSIALEKNILINCSEATSLAIKEWKTIQAWLKKGENHKEFQEKYASIYQRFDDLTKQIKILLQHEQLLSLKSQSIKHRYANDVLYNDLRRYLLKYPL